MTEPALLIVDDLEDNRVALAMRLELAGYRNVTHAANGVVALALMREQHFDVVLLDIMMPEMDGYQVLEEMKADTELRDTPVIMISAVEEMDSVIRCIELGAADYLTKPFNPTLLKARVDIYVERARYKAQEAAYFENVEAEKKRVDHLLSTLLPRQIAQVLKANESLSPVRYDGITVLSCDVVDFTSYTECHPPELVFAQLESLIEAFEQILDEHGLAKIKTMGDAIMATCGLLSDNDDPVAASTACALEMVRATGRHADGWQVRVGIDHGSMVAGMIGRTQLQFDVWGDAVNTAVRIESIGAPGTVNLSGRAWQHIRGKARGRSLGLVELKGKETIEVIECQGWR